MSKVRITRVRVTLSSLLLSLMLLSGCDFNQANSSAKSPSQYDVAVVDLDTVVNKTALRQRIEDSVTQRQATLQLQLDQVQQTLQAQYDVELAKMPEEKTEEQSTQLAGLMNNLNLEFDKNRDELSDRLAAYRQELNANMLKEIKPIVQAVAADIGAKVVMHKNNNLLFSVSQSVDITDEVIALVKQK